MGYKLLGFVVWKSWLRLLGYKKRDAKARLRERKVLIGAGVALSAVAVATVVALAHRDTSQ
jgi:hypothetical protein